MCDPYLCHDEQLEHHSFFKATYVNLRHGDYRGSPRILAHGVTQWWMRELFASRCGLLRTRRRVHLVDEWKIGDTNVNANRRRTNTNRLWESFFVFIHSFRGSVVLTVRVRHECVSNAMHHYALPSEIAILTHQHLNRPWRKKEEVSVDNRKNHRHLG